MKLLLTAALLLGYASASSRPDSVPADFDCAMRQLALDFANTKLSALRPSRRHPTPATSNAVGLVRDALEIDAYGCSTAPPPNLNPPSSSSPPPQPPLTDPSAIYVDSSVGSDENSGSSTDPMLTLTAAVQISRKSNTTKTIYLRGTFYTKQIQLNEEDSGLTIMTDPEEEEFAVLSGGVPLTTIQWEKTPTPNVFSADLSSFSFSDVPGLHFPSLSQRGTVARFPNTPDPFQMNEEFSGDQRIAQGVATWLPPKPYKETDFSYVQIPGARDDTPDGWFQDYVHGVGGSCEVYDPPVSYWCSNATQGGGAFQFMIPSGIVLDESFLPNLSKYTPTSLNQAVVNAWRPARWENWMFEGDFDINSKTFTFNKGGFQGARGEKEGGDWFIENVFEELDSENEFFYNRSSKMLFFYVNASFTSSPDDYGVMVVPQEEGVFNILGASQSNPVKDLSIESVTITGTRHTYLTAPHSVPSGGDWALERRGAILLENTESTSIENVKINMVDGHGGQISGYNRNATFKGNHFSWVGGSAIVSWGRTDGETDEEAFSGMGGNWPRFNLIENNVAREVGHFEKQNSFYVQAKTAQSTIRNNLFFNGPRAGVNYNDGFGGGDVLEGNLIFNTCRESGDHGPFNSWDRQPFLTPVVDEDGSTAMEWRTIRSNFMIGNYQSQETVDNDDGSGYYLTEDNFLVYSSNGLKSDFGGHDNHHIGNIYAYVGSGSWGSGSCMSDGASQLDGHEDLYQNNFCVLSEGGDYGSFDASTAYPKMGDNDIYVSGEDDVGTVGLNGMALADFQAANPGVDDGSTVALLDDWEIIINKGRALLGL